MNSAFSAFPDDRDKVQLACEDQLRKLKASLNRRETIERTNEDDAQSDDDDDDDEAEYVPPQRNGRRASAIHGDIVSKSPARPRNLLPDAKLSLLPNFSENEESGSIQFRSSRMSNSSINRPSKSPSMSSIKMGNSNPMLASSPLKHTLESPGSPAANSRASIKRNPIASLDELHQMKNSNRRVSVLQELDSDDEITGDDSV